MRYRSKRSRRRGSVLVLTALMMTAFLMLLAFAVDIGYMGAIRGEVQNTSDAAALAAAAKLLDRDELKGAPNQTSEMSMARTEAQTYARLNSNHWSNFTWDGVTPVLGRNDGTDPSEGSANNPDGDIVTGYIANPSDHASAMQYNTGLVPSPFSPPLLFLPSIVNPNLPFITPPLASTTYHSYNSVLVRARRSSVRNGPPELLFGNVFGSITLNIEASSTATWEDNIRGFQAYPNTPPWAAAGLKTSKLLPFAMDVNTFGAMAAGLSTIDLFKYDATKSVPPNTYADRVSMADPDLLNNERLNPLHQNFDPAALFRPDGVSELVSSLFPGDGIKEALLVPLSVVRRTNGIPILLGGQRVSVGNFGAVYIGNRAREDIYEFTRQIREGPSEQDFAEHDPSQQRLALNSLNAEMIIQGDTVIKNALKQVLESIRGQPRIIMLFRANGNTPFPPYLGTEADYTIVGFGGVTVLAVFEIPETPEVRDPLTGAVLVPAGEKSLRLLVQPEFVIDATAIGGGSTLGSGTTSRFVYRPLAITR